MLAKEETRQKKAEKAKQYIIEEEDGVRSSRKAAQKARDFVKNLGEGIIMGVQVDAETVQRDAIDYSTFCGGRFPQGDIFFALDYLQMIACMPVIAGQGGGCKQDKNQNQCKQALHRKSFLSFDLCLLF